jgi:hypothetical protein
MAGQLENGGYKKTGEEEKEYLSWSYRTDDDTGMQN